MMQVKFKTQAKVEVGTVDVCLELNDKDVDSGDGEDSDTEYT